MGIKNKYDLVRYADDLVAFASSRAECEDMRALAIAELDKLGLKIDVDKTSISAPDEPVEFLGLELQFRPAVSSYGLLVPASFFEKKQAIDNATKVAIFGTLYWTHL